MYKIYKLHNEDESHVYIGYTKQTLNDRRMGHISAHKLSLKGARNYVSSSSVIAACKYPSEVKITLVEDGICDIKQALNREAYHIKHIACVNVQHKTVTAKNKQYIRRESWQSKRHTCENCGSNVRRSCLARHKKSSKCVNYGKPFVLAKPVTVTNACKSKNPTVQCSNCGSKVKRANLSRHKKTVKCISRIKQKPKVAEPNVRCSTCGETYKVGQCDAHFRSITHIAYVETRKMYYLAVLSKTQLKAIPFSARKKVYDRFQLLADKVHGLSSYWYHRGFDIETLLV